MLFFLISVIFSVYSTSSSASVSIFCGKHTTEQLTTILGSHYDSKLMAIEALDQIGRSRKEWLNMFSQNTSELLDDDVDSNTKYEILEQIYENMKRNYECGSYTKMKDLGPNYFPRYIFPISCQSSQCIQKTEKLKLLRRRIGDTRPCVSTWWLRNRESWAWEELHINSGCDV